MLNPNSAFCGQGMDWPLFVSTAAPRDGNEIDRKEPVGTVTGGVLFGGQGRENCSPDHAIGQQCTACSGCRCSLAGALRVLPRVLPSFAVRHLQMWKVIPVEGFMFSPPAYSCSFSYGPVH